MARPPILERHILDLLWSRGRWSVREVLDQLDRPLAYSTVSTVLRRLVRKGEAVRIREGAAWRYSATRSREATIALKVSALIEEIRPDDDLLLEALVEQLEVSRPEALGRLRALLSTRAARPPRP